MQNLKLREYLVRLQILAAAIAIVSGSLAIAYLLLEINRIL